MSMRATRRFEWATRVGTRQLGIGNELWLPARLLPEYPLFAEASRRFAFDVRSEITLHLLEDVVAAAGAVEYSVEKLEAAVVGSIARLNELGFSWFEGEREPEYGMHVTIGDLWPAYAEYNNLLTWIRALQERISRRIRIGHNMHIVGLLPSIAPGTLRDDVERLYGEINRDLFDGVRPLSNYVIHRSVIPTSGLSAQARVRHGQLVLEVPDPSPHALRTISTRFDLTWETGQGADAFAREALACVGRFVDGVLDSFAAHVPLRFRQSERAEPGPKRSD